MYKKEELTKDELEYRIVPNIKIYQPKETEIQAMEYNGDARTAMAIEFFCCRSFVEWDKGDIFYGLKMFTKKGIKKGKPVYAEEGDFIAKYHGGFILIPREEFKNKYKEYYPAPNNQTQNIMKEFDIKALQEQEKVQLPVTDLKEKTKQFSFFQKLDLLNLMKSSGKVGFRGLRGSFGFFSASGYMFDRGFSGTSDYMFDDSGMIDEYYRDKVDSSPGYVLVHNVFPELYKHINAAINVHLQHDKKDEYDVLANCMIELKRSNKLKTFFYNLSRKKYFK